MTQHDTVPGLRRAELAVVASVILFALGFAAVTGWGGGQRSWDIVRRLPPRIVPVLLGLSLVNFALRCGRWLLFSRSLRLGVPTAANALYYIAGFAMTTTPGKMGEMVRLYLLRRFHGCAYERTAPLLIADRLSDGISTTLVVAATVAFYAHYPKGAAGALLLAAGLIFVSLKPAVLLPPIGWLFARLRRWPRIFVKVRRAIRGLQVLSDPMLFTTALILGALSWTIQGLGLFALLHGLGVALGPPACVFIFGFSMLVGAASIMPGGLGSAEATMVTLLALQGVDFKTAMVATGLIRIMTLWFAVALGLLALPVALAGAGRASRKAVAVG